MQERTSGPPSDTLEGRHGRHLVEEGMLPLALPPRYANMRGTMDVGALYPESGETESHEARENPASLQWVKDVTGRSPESLSADVARVGYVVKGRELPKQSSEEGGGTTRSLTALLRAFEDDEVPEGPADRAPVMWSRVVPKILMAQNAVHPSRTLLSLLSGRVQAIPPQTPNVRKQKQLRFHRSAGKNALMAASTAASGAIGWFLYQNFAVLPLVGIIVGLAVTGLCLGVVASLAVMRFATKMVDVPVKGAEHAFQPFFIRAFDGKPTHCTMELSEDRRSLVILTEDTYQTHVLEASSGEPRPLGRIKVKDQITITYRPGRESGDGKFHVVYACHAQADSKTHALYENGMAALHEARQGDASCLDCFVDELSATMARDFFELAQGDVQDGHSEAVREASDPTLASDPGSTPGQGESSDEEAAQGASTSHSGSDGAAGESSAGGRDDPDDEGAESEEEPSTPSLP